MRWLLLVIVAVLAFIGLSTALARLVRETDDDAREELPHRVRRSGGA